MPHVIDTVIKHVLQYPNGKFVALDSTSGGYPYQDEVISAWNFRSEQEALKYAAHFPREEMIYKIIQVTYQEI